MTSATASSTSKSGTFMLERRRRKGKGVLSTPRRYYQSCMGVFGGVAALLCLFIYTSQNVIDGDLKKSSLSAPVVDEQEHLGVVLMEPENAMRVAVAPPTKKTKYIVFRQYKFGQGAGNSISGLMAAHLLGDEFDRLVCIASDETDLLDAFQPKSAQALIDCPTLPPKSTNNNMTLDILLLNYGKPPNECQLRNAMADDSAPIVWFSGNTYPRWPKRIPTHLTFTKLYTPTLNLINTLTWWHDTPPHTVVHLRHGDSRNDVRQGLDMDTLRALGKEIAPPLEEKPFLVTNWLSWYTFFEQYYGWHHPPWVSVQHSAMVGVTWADLDKAAEVPLEERNLQLWADWYTIVKARGVVLHTHSDFSLSACHWMNMEHSRTIRGVNEADGTLDLTEDWFRTQDVTPPLSKRTTAELQNCHAREVVVKTRPRADKNTLEEERRQHLVAGKSNAQQQQKVVRHQEIVTKGEDSEFESQDEKDEREDGRREKQDFLRSKTS